MEGARRFALHRSRPVSRPPRRLASCGQLLRRKGLIFRIKGILAIRGHPYKWLRLAPCARMPAPPHTPPVGRISRRRRRAVSRLGGRTGCRVGGRLAGRSGGRRAVGTVGRLGWSGRPANRRPPSRAVDHPIPTRAAISLTDRRRTTHVLPPDETVRIWRTTQAGAANSLRDSSPMYHRTSIRRAEEPARHAHRVLTSGRPES